MIYVGFLLSWGLQVPYSYSQWSKECVITHQVFLQRALDFQLVPHHIPS